MTCQSVIEFLSDYLAGRLPVRQRLVFGLHLMLCGDCRAYLHNFRTAILTGRLAECRCDDVPEGLVRAILRSCGECRQESISEAP
jgi:predicted anti-sigma-YlaC factor YlaD